MHCYNIWQHNEMAVTSAITMWLSFSPVAIKNKIAGHTNTHTARVLEMIKTNIFLRPEEAMM